MAKSAIFDFVKFSKTDIIMEVYERLKKWVVCSMHTIFMKFYDANTGSNPKIHFSYRHRSIICSPISSGFKLAKFCKP